MIKAALGSREAVRQVVTVNGDVNVAPDSVVVPPVINGAWDVLVRLFGDADGPARAAVRVASLPESALAEV